MNSAIVMSLGEVCQSIDYGVTTSANFNVDGPQFLRITDITQEGVDWAKVPRCVISQAEERTALLQDGDIVVARTGGTVGKSFLVQMPPRAVSASYLLRLRVREEIVLPEYVSLFFGSDTYWTQLMDAARGAAQPNVNATTLSTIILPVPGLDEQRRIAARLKAQLAAVEEARQAAQAQVNDAQNLQRALLEAVFKNISGESKPVEEFMQVVRGSSPRPQGDKRYFGGNVPRLMVEDVTRDGMYVIPRIDSLTEIGATMSRPMKAGSLTMVVSGAPGLPAILAVDACIHDGFIGFPVIDTSIADIEYLYFWFLYQRAETDRHATGAIFRNLTTDQVKTMEVLLPSLAIQRNIVEKLIAQLEAATALKAGLADQLQEIELLPARLLAQAFENVE